jgi:hypothetical protein
MDVMYLIAQVVGGVAGLFIAVCLFYVMVLVIRELTAWYFKTNEIIELLKQIKDNGDKNE